MKQTVAGIATQPTDVTDLRAFCLVVDLGSITAAARALGETKGSVSRRLTRLEQLLSVSLLRRSPRVVSPTDDGQAYRVRIGNVLDLLDEANSAVQQSNTSARGHLRVTAPLDVGVTVIAPLIAGFAEKHPEVTVEMLLTEAVLDFDAHQLDLAFRISQALRDSSLVAHKLRRMRGGLFAAPGYLKGRSAPQVPDDLHAHRLVLSRTMRGHSVMTLRNEKNNESVQLRLKATISASEYSFAREVALAGGGITMLPDMVARRDVLDGRLIPVLEDYVPDAELYMFLLHQGGKFLSPRVKVFRDYMVEAFRAMCAKHRAEGIVPGSSAQMYEMLTATH